MVMWLLLLRYLRNYAFLLFFSFTQDLEDCSVKNWLSLKQWLLKCIVDNDLGYNSRICTSQICFLRWFWCECPTKHPFQKYCNKIYCLADDRESQLHNGMASPQNIGFFFFFINNKLRCVKRYKTHPSEDKWDQLGKGMFEDLLCCQQFSLNNSTIICSCNYLLQQWWHIKRKAKNLLKHKRFLPSY